MFRSNSRQIERVTGTSEECVKWSCLDLQASPGKFYNQPGGGGTPGSSWWGYAARFSKSWPYLGPKNCHFPHLFSDLAFRQKLCHHFYFAYFYFVLIHLELKRWIRSYTPVVSSKSIPDSGPKTGKVYSMCRLLPSRHWWNLGNKHGPAGFTLWCNFWKVTIQTKLFQCLLICLPS